MKGKAILLLCALCLLGAAPREPRPGDLASEVPRDVRNWPIDAIEAERRLLGAEEAEYTRRGKLLSEAEVQRKSRLRARLAAFYKLSHGALGKLLLSQGAQRDYYRVRDAGRRLLERDLEELAALQKEKQVLSMEQTQLGTSTRLAVLEEEVARSLSQKEKARPVIGLALLRGSLRRPVFPGQILLPFGKEVVERGVEVYHHGVELSAQQGGAVHAVAAGQVRYVGDIPGVGMGVILEHEGGYLTLYGRMERIPLIAGDNVAEGATLGRALFQKLYFRLTLGDLPLDPEPWFTGRG